MPEEYFFEEEGCYITELSNSENDPAVSIAKARVLPGVTTAWHWLSGTVERYVILSGKGEAEVGEEPARPVSAGDAVIIPAKLRQRITNVGKEDLIFLAICTPCFEMQNYHHGV